MEGLLRTTACEADQTTEVEWVIALVMKEIEGKDGADAVCHLRALYLREPTCGESFWNPPPN